MRRSSSSKRCAAESRSRLAYCAIAGALASASIIAKSSFITPPNAILSRKRRRHSDHADQEVERPVSAGAEADAEPGWPDQALRADECGRRPEVAGARAPVVELVDAPAFERDPGVRAIVDDARDLLEVAQGSEGGLLPGELVDGIAGEPERASQQEGVVGGQAGAEVGAAVDARLENVLAETFGVHEGQLAARVLLVRAHGRGGPEAAQDEPLAVAREPRLVEPVAEQVEPQAARVGVDLGQGGGTGLDVCLDVAPGRAHAQFAPLAEIGAHIQAASRLPHPVLGNAVVAGKHAAVALAIEEIGRDEEVPIAREGLIELGEDIRALAELRLELPFRAVLRQPGRA